MSNVTDLQSGPPGPIGPVGAPVRLLINYYTYTRAFGVFRVFVVLRVGQEKEDHLVTLVFQVLMDETELLVLEVLKENLAIEDSQAKEVFQDQLYVIYV